MAARETPIEYCVRLLGTVVDGRACAGPQALTTPLPNIGVISTGVETVDTFSGRARLNETAQIDVRSRSYLETHQIKEAAIRALESGGRVQSLLSIGDLAETGVLEDGAILYRNTIVLSVGA